MIRDVILVNALLLHAWGQRELPAVIQPGRDAIMSSYEFGAKEGANKALPDKVIARWSKNIARVPNFGRNRHWQAPFVTFTPPQEWAEMQGLDDARQYKGQDDFLKTLDGVLSAKPVVSFDVTLYAWPYPDKGVPARRSEITDVRFVLLVDGDRTRVLRPITDPEKLDASTIRGHYVDRTQATVRDRYTGQVFVYSRSERESYQAYEARYTVAFPVDGASGAGITDSTKTLELKIISPVGEHSAVFKLSDYPPK